MKITKIELQNLCNKYKSGKTYIDLKHEFHLDVATIKSYLQKSNISLRSRSECSRQFKIKEAFFDNIDVQEKAYMLGFLYADGNNDTNMNRIRIDLDSRDKEILEKFAELIYLEPRPLRKIKAHTDSKGRIRRELWELTITNKHISETLNNIGMVARKSLILEFPKFLDKDMLPHFIRGYNDGDGCIEIREKDQSRVEILGTNDFCGYIKSYIMETLNIKSYIRKHKKIFKLSINGSYALKFLDWIYKDSNIHLTRKYNKYLEAKSLKQKAIEKKLSKKCCICGEKHYAKSFCRYHYYHNKRLNKS